MAYEVEEKHFPDEKTADWLQIVTNEGVNIERLIALYKEAVNLKDQNFAKTFVAEAVTSESTAMHNMALESTSRLLATAISKLA
jgi:hypothetical protein